MMMLAAGLIGYSSLWMALRLMGEPRRKSAIRALIAAILAVAGICLLTRFGSYGSHDASVLPSLSGLNTSYSLGNSGIPELPVAILYALILLGYLSFLSGRTGRKWIPSIVCTMLGLTACLTGQLMIACFRLGTNPGDPRLLLPGIFLYLLMLPLWKSENTIFGEDILLDREQRRSMNRLAFSLFPGPMLLVVWSSYVLTETHLQTLPVLVFSILFTIILCILLGRIVSAMREHIENVLDKQYQAELLNFMGLIRSQRHDFNFHLQTVYGMIAKQEYDACQEYIRSMLSTVQTSNDVLPIANPAISALLSTFQEMAIQKGLRLDVEIHDDLSHIPCTVYEINTILGNLIQNAIDELDAHTEGSRIIHLLIIKRGRNNMLKIRNFCHRSSDEMKEIFTPGYTTKPSHEGLGLANASRIAEKYGGVVYPEFEGDMIHMIARIPMKLY